jgi:hypothetical protein
MNRRVSIQEIFFTALKKPSPCPLRKLSLSPKERYPRIPCSDSSFLAGVFSKKRDETTHSASINEEKRWL